MKNYIYIFNHRYDKDGIFELIDKFNNKLASVDASRPHTWVKLEIICNITARSYIPKEQLKQMSNKHLSMHKQICLQLMVAGRIAMNPDFVPLKDISKEDPGPCIIVIIIDFEDVHVPYMQKLYNLMYNAESEIVKLDNKLSEKRFESLWREMLAKHYEMKWEN